MSNVLNEIKRLLGLEIKLEQTTLDNGTVVEAEMFQAGQQVFIVNGEDRVALPIGEYILENGMVLTVTTEGEIAEIKEANAPEEVEQEVEAQAEAPAPANATAKKVIESTVKESHFSAEEVEALKTEIENLKTQLEEMKPKEVEEVEKVELSVEPLTHNPDAKTETKMNLYSQSRQRTTLDIVMSKLAN